MAMTPSAMTKCTGAVAQISRMLRWMPFQCRTFLGHPYFMPGTMPNMFFMLSVDRKSTRLNSSHANISYAVFCLKNRQFLECLHFARGRLLDGAICDVRAAAP